MSSTCIMETQNNYFFISSSEVLPCNETGAVRLTGSSLDYVGRVEVCYDGHWGTVCDDSATNATADVVCRQLDHAALGKHYNYALPHTFTVWFGMF